MANSSIDLLISIPGSPPLCIIAPETLKDLYQLISEHIRINTDSFHFMYDRKGTLYRIIDDRTYASLIQKGIAAQQEEINLLVEIPNRTDMMIIEEIPEPPKVQEIVIKEEAKMIEDFPANELTLLYKVLNSVNNKFRKIRIEKDEKLSKLASEILKDQLCLRPDWTCAIYTEDGYPIVGTLSQLYIISCCEVLKNKEKICVFIVPYFDNKIEPALNHEIGDSTIFVKHITDENKRYAIKLDFSTCTVLNLKQKLFNIAGVPPFELKIKTDDRYLVSDIAYLSSFGVVENQILTYQVESFDYKTTTYKPILVQSLTQTIKGQRTLHSFLYCLSKNKPEKVKLDALLACIRCFTNNCSPLLHSLCELSRNSSMSVLDSIALEEGFIILIKNVLQEMFKTVIPDNKLLEQTLDIMGILCEISSKNEPELQRLENYEVYSIICPISFVQIERPVCLRKNDGKYCYLEYSAVVQKARDRQEIAEIGLINEADIKEETDFKYLIKRAALNKKESLEVWTGSYSGSISIMDYVRKTFPRGVTYIQSMELKNNHKLTKIVAPLSLKAPEFKHCITWNKTKEICINCGLTPKMPNKVDLMNILDLGIETVDVSELASAIEIHRREDEGNEIITRIPDEAIVVLFDTSGSMNTTFSSTEDYTRLDLTKQIFESFADRTIGYNLKNITSLILFSSKVTKICSFTENVLTFTRTSKTIQAGGQTKLWDAIFEAAKELKEIKKSYPDVILRILCLSDGEDNYSTKSDLEAAKTLLYNNITMDAVVVGALSQNLKAVCFSTGGYVFLPSNIQEGIKLFESETFLSVGCRQSNPRVSVSDETDLAQLQNKDFSTNQPKIKPPQQSSLQAENPRQTIHRASVTPPRLDTSNSAVKYKRIMKELHSITMNPHPSASIYPCELDTAFWNVFMKGPDHTPYEGGLFHLYMKFGEDYPLSPPEVRFITPVYHCNINATGRICHSVLDQFYTVDTTTRYILDCIYGLFMTPEPLDPLDANIAAEYRDNYAIYEIKARDHTRRHAGKTIEELTRGLLSNDNEQGAPKHLLDPITGVIMDDPVIVKKTNTCYSRETIVKAIQFTGKDPITGVDITMDDLIPNVALKNEIDTYFAALQKPWFL